MESTTMETEEEGGDSVSYPNYQSLINDMIEIYNSKGSITKLKRLYASDDDVRGGGGHSNNNNIEQLLQSQEAAIKSLDQYTCGLLNYLPKGIIIGGSTILRCVYKQPREWEPHDVDFYFQSHPPGSFKSKSGDRDSSTESEEEFHKNIWKMDSLLRGLGEIVIIRSACVITYIIRLAKQEDPKTNIPKHFVAQLILAPTTVDLLLASYHGDLVSVAYDTTTKSFFYTERFKRFLETGESRFTNVFLNTTSTAAGVKKAFFKYKKRGFNLIEAFDQRISSIKRNYDREEEFYSKSNEILDIEDFLKGTTTGFTESLKQDIWNAAAAKAVATARLTQRNLQPMLRGVVGSPFKEEEEEPLKLSDIKDILKLYDRLADCIGEGEEFKSYLEMFIDLYHVKICMRCEKMVLLEDEATKKYLARVATGSYLCKNCFYEMVWKK